jgi:hypothetical protein
MPDSKKFCQWKSGARIVDAIRLMGHKGKGEMLPSSVQVAICANDATASPDDLS